MSNNKHTESDPERTLLTLDQLSQTIEVMTSVVNRLRQHLSDQILARKANEQEEREMQQLRSTRARQTRDSNVSKDSKDSKDCKDNKDREDKKDSKDSKDKKNLELVTGIPNAEHSGAEDSCPASTEDRESFVVEITQPEVETQPKGNKTLH